LFGPGRGGADVNEGRTYIARHIRKFIYILQDFGGRIYIPAVYCACVSEKHTIIGRKICYEYRTEADCHTVPEADDLRPVHVPVWAGHPVHGADPQVPGGGCG